MRLFLSKIKYAWKLFFRLFGGYKKKIVLIILLAIISGFLGGLGIGALIPLISFALNNGRLGGDLISRSVGDLFNFLGVVPAIAPLLIFISLIFIFKAIAIFIFNYIIARISNDCENDYRKYFYDATFKANWPYLSQHKIGQLQNMLFAHVESIPRLMNALSSIFLNLTSFLTYLIMALNISLLTTGIAFCAGVVLLFFSRPFVRITKTLSRRQAEINIDMSHEINENVMGLKTIKAMNVEEKSGTFAFRVFNELRSNKLKTHMVKKLNTLSVEPISVISVAIIFSVMYSRPSFDFGVFTVLLYLIQKIFAYVEDFQGSFHSLSSVLAYVGRLLDFEKEILNNEEVDMGKRNFIFENHFMFENVTFSYSKNDSETLKNISFKVKKGEMVGIIGPSGAGKTTLVDLMLRLLEPSSGNIKMDGISIKDIKLSEWRKNIGYVSQDIFLKNDTILNNIRFYDDSISEKDIIEAARSAVIYDFIKDLPDGFNTIVGERGIRLSGGERQRIILARVFARKPKLLILDEATSSLDNESEAQIKKAIYAIKGGITIIAIAHRLSTVMNADKLLVLDHGEIIEEGDPHKLLGDKSSYFYKAHNIIE